MLVDGEGWQRRARIRLTTVGATAPGVTGVWAVVTHLGRRQRTQPALTAAQIRIVALLAAGRSNADIAEELRLSRQTLDYHLSRLRVLLEAPTRPAMVARAYVLGILSPAPGHPAHPRRPTPPARCDRPRDVRALKAYAGSACATWAADAKSALSAAERSEGGR